MNQQPRQQTQARLPSSRKRQMNNRSALVQSLRANPPRAVSAQPTPRRRRQRRKGENDSPFSSSQVGAVIRTRLTRSGVGDIKRLRIAWVAGTTWVGNGTNGTANSVYFLTGSGTWIIQGFVAGAGGSGQIPIASSDTDIGQAYVRDIEKHFARKVIRRMWIHVDSLQPSTSNNMMAVFGISRGPGGMSRSIPITAATAAITSNTVGNVASMRGAFVVDSWEHKTIDITEFIAGGSGPQQNEFEIVGTPSAASIYVTTATVTTIDGNGLVPACFSVAGNCTTAGLQGTSVHQITFEQEVDLLDFTGGMASNEALD